MRLLLLAGFELVGAAEWPALGAVGCRQGGVHQRMWHGNWQRNTRRRDCHHSMVRMFGAPAHPLHCNAPGATDALMLDACCQAVLAVKQSMLSGDWLGLTPKRALVACPAHAGPTTCGATRQPLRAARLG